MKRILLFILLTGIALSATADPVKITSWDIDRDVNLLNKAHFSVDNVNRETNTIIVYVRDEDEFGRLLALGYAAQRLPNLAKEYARELWEMTRDSDNPKERYFSYDQYIQFMQQTAQQYQNICSLVQFGTSVQGRSLLMMKISDNVNMSEAEPQFQWVSSIHGDEVVGYDLLIRLIQLLTAHYGTDPRITNLVNNTEIWINPMMNPDGYVNASRYNATGVDLNRNFPMPTGTQHPDGNPWAPETVAMMNFSQDRRISLSINYHGGALVMNYPWDYTYVLAPDDALLQQAALAYSVHNPAMYNSSTFPQGITNGAAWYVITGSMQDWLYHYTSGIDITCEVGDIKWPAASQLDSYWAANQESILSYMEFMHRGVRGLVTDPIGNPIPAVITMTGNSKAIRNSGIGYFHRMLLPGNYTLTASADGYIPQSFALTVPASGSVTQNVILQPAQMVSLNGIVRNQQGLTIANAQVTIGDNPPVQTSATGTLALSSIAEGDYDVTIRATGYAVYKQNLKLRQAHNNPVFVLSQPIFADDFESGLSGWTVQTPWAIVTESTNLVLTDSPAGNYGSNVNRSATLASPVSLANISNPYLNFDIRYDLEESYDFLHVEASVNGTNWTNLTSFSGTQSTWINVTLPLNAYAGQNVLIRFRLRSDWSISADGAYIDNVQINGTPVNAVIYGDIDANWQVTGYDAKYILDYVVGLDPVPQIDSIPWLPSRITAADVNADQSITALDAYLVNHYTRNPSFRFPAQNNIPFNPPDPGVQIHRVGDTLRISASQPQHLYAMNGVFHAMGGLSISDWTTSPPSAMTLTSFHDLQRRFAYARHNPTDLLTYLQLTFSTQADSIYCDAWINGNLMFYAIPTAGSPSDDPILPVAQFSLLQNAPNPFNPSTTIRYSIPRDGLPVHLVVYNHRGQMIRQLVNEHQASGWQQVVWDGRDEQGRPVSSGIYYYRLSIPSQTEIRKMVLLK